MRINLNNVTCYRDSDLHVMLRAACERAGVDLNLLHVDVVHSRGRHVSGWAQFPIGPRAGWKNQTRTMRLRIPKPPLVPDNDLKLQVAQVMLHEAMHLAGARHKDMTEEQYTCRMPVPWADDMVLLEKPLREPAPADKAAARAGRLEHAQAMLSKAVTRRKRAMTIEKKWARRVKALSR